jgi:hypothetical protein
VECVRWSCGCPCGVCRGKGPSGRTRRVAMSLFRAARSIPCHRLYRCRYMSANGVERERPREIRAMKPVDQRSTQRTNCTNWCARRDSNAHFLIRRSRRVAVLDHRVHEAPRV